MMSFLSTLGWGFAALLAVAVAVASWEHLRSKTRKRAPLPGEAPRRVVSLDVDLDRLPEGAAGPTAGQGDQAQRAAALDGALGRMGTPPAAARLSGQAWTETQPMVAASLKVELPAQPADTPHA